MQDDTRLTVCASLEPQAWTLCGVCSQGFSVVGDVR